MSVCACVGVYFFTKIDLRKTVGGIFQHFKSLNLVLTSVFEHFCSLDCTRRFDRLDQYFRADVIEGVYFYLQVVKILSD